MPSLSGAGLIKEVLQINPKLPTILITANRGEQIPEDIVSRIRHIMQKPFNASALLDVIRTELAKARQEQTPM